MSRGRPRYQEAGRGTPMSSKRGPEAGRVREGEAVKWSWGQAEVLRGGTRGLRSIRRAGLRASQGSQEAGNWAERQAEGPRSKPRGLA